MSLKISLGELITLAVVVALCFASWLGGEGEGYLFPRQIALAMLVIAVAAMVETMIKPGEASDGVKWRLILPAVAIGVAYLAVLEPLGFYTSSGLAFFAISVLYGGGGDRRAATAVRCGVVTLAFIAALYLLFNVGLRVQTPIGLLI